MVKMVQLRVTSDKSREMIQRFNAVNIEMGYKPIAIYSPMEVTKYGRESS